MKKIVYLTLSLLVAVTFGFAQKANFHSFKTKTIDGADFDLASLKGKKVLVVNTASKCGLTPQYKDLQELYAKYGRRNLESALLARGECLLHRS
jgi:glutathione peroxidase